MELTLKLVNGGVYNPSVVWFNKRTKFNYSIR